MTARLVLAPGGACQPPPEVIGQAVSGLTDTEKGSALVYISAFHPEAFEEALADVQRVRDWRARRAARQDGAR